MCLLFETIKLENRQLQNLDYHNERLNRSRFELFGSKEELRIEDSVILPSNLTNQIYKCRVVYKEDIQKIEIELYQKRKIENLILVESNIDYSYKYFDRRFIETLTTALKPREDILIIKNGFITDTSYSNVCFWDGQKWITPDTPLLRGTKRKKLLDEKKIYEKTICKEDIVNFEKVSLINGMLELGDCKVNLNQHMP